MKKPPEDRSIGDAAHEVGRAIVAAVPAVGGPLQVLYENVFQAPLDRRKQAWLEELAGVVSELEQRIDGFRAETLAENEVFISVALQASQTAIRNHQREKLDALRNAVLNSALPTSPSEDEQMIFLRLVDDLAPWHLRLLAFLDDPGRWVESHEIELPFIGGALSNVIEACFRELVGRRDLYDQLVRDLQAEGLAAGGSYLHGMMTGQGMIASRTSDLGKRFLKYISQPSDDHI